MNKILASKFAVGTILLLIVVIGGIFLIYGNKRKEIQVPRKISQEQENFKKETKNVKSDKQSEQTISQTKNPNTEWIQYNNTDIGIHFQYPKKIYTDLIKCNEPMPIKIDATKETYGQKGAYYEIGVGTPFPFAGNKNCKPLSFSLGYTIDVGDVSNTNDLETFIKKIFGSDCKLVVEKSEGKTSYNIDLGDWASGKSNCFISGKGGIQEYSPEKKKAILFETGQDVQWDMQIDENFFTSIKLL